MMRDFGRALNMFERSLAGETFKEMSSDFGVTAGRCAHLVRWTASLLLHPKRLQGDVPLDHDFYSAIERRTHPEFWRRQIDKARTAIKG